MSNILEFRLSNGNLSGSVAAQQVMPDNIKAKRNTIFLIIVIDSLKIKVWDDCVYDPVAHHFRIQTGFNHLPC